MGGLASKRAVTSLQIHCKPKKILSMYSRVHVESWAPFQSSKVEGLLQTRPPLLSLVPQTCNPSNIVQRSMALIFCAHAEANSNVLRPDKASIRVLSQEDMAIPSLGPDLLLSRLKADDDLIFETLGYHA